MSASAAALDPNAQAALANLRDVRLPGTVSWWPPAPGWWVVLGIALVAIGVSAWLAWQRRRTPARAALRELRALRRTGLERLPPREIASALGELARRTALARDRAGGLAPVHGEGWSAFLAKGAAGMPLDVARYIAAAPYVAPEAAADAVGTGAFGTDRGAGEGAPASIRVPSANELFDTTERWLRRSA